MRPTNTKSNRHSHNGTPTDDLARDIPTTIATRLNSFTVKEAAKVRDAKQLM
jgi:hypothetical protein